MLRRFNDETETFGRFLIVGVINTLVGCSIMFGLYNFAGLGYWLSSAANFLFTSILSFFLNKKYTFRHSGELGGSALRFAINIAVCYIIAYAIAKPVAGVVFGNMSRRACENLAMGAGLCMFTIFNYLGQRFFAFRKKEDS